MKDQLKETQPPSKTTKVTSGQTPSKPVVIVRYILVVPKDEPHDHDSDKPVKWGWKFPAGWDEVCKINDHRGGLYCLEISQ